MTSDDDPPHPETGTRTDGEVPGPIDKALLGGPAQRVGSFGYDYDTDTWTWSDAVARLHGYEPGDVHPTTELVLKHKHPDDVAQVRMLLRRSSAPFSSRHRIYTTAGDLRSVVVVGEVVRDGTGAVTATRGFYIDITKMLDDERRDVIDDELQQIVDRRAVIDQAKGMLMAIYDLNAEAAFNVLRWRSQETNIKLVAIAREVIAKAPGLLGESGRAWSAPVDHLLMNLDRPNRAGFDL